MSSHSSIIIDLPVFNIEDNGHIARISSFNPDNKEFTVTNLTTGIPCSRNRPIDAKNLYLTKSNRRKSPDGDLRALIYLLDLGVSNIVNLPEGWSQKHQVTSIRHLLHTLEEFDMNTSGYDEYHYTEDDVVNVCRVNITPRGKLLKHIVAILSNHGYIVKEINTSYGKTFSLQTRTKTIYFD